MVNPVTTCKALREYRKSYTRSGVLTVIAFRWQKLIFHPQEELQEATRLYTGNTFT